MARRILKEFTIDEISAVDRPSQIGAKMAILKRAGDDTLTIDGTEFRRSLIGDTAFNILKRQADQIAENQEKLTKVRAKEANTMDKANEVDLAQMGKFTELVARLQSQGDAHPQDTAARREPAGYLAWLKFQEGIRENITKAASDGFEALVKVVQARDLCTGLDALRKAREEFPIVFNEYQFEGQRAYAADIAKADPDPGSPKAVRDFQDKVDEIAARDRLSKTAALSKARAQHPELYKAYQAA